MRFDLFIQSSVLPLECVPSILIEVYNFTRYNSSQFKDSNNNIVTTGEINDYNIIV